MSTHNSTQHRVNVKLERRRVSRGESHAPECGDDSSTPRHGNCLQSEGVWLGGRWRRERKEVGGVISDLPPPPNALFHTHTYTRNLHLCLVSPYTVIFCQYYTHNTCAHTPPVVSHSGSWLEHALTL